MFLYLPTFVYLTIYDIDFGKLYAEGKKIIITDLDNTLLPYYQNEADDKLKLWNKKRREEGYKIYIITNNNDKRIKKVQQTFLIDGYVARTNKPNSNKLKKYLQQNQIDLSKTILLGDQLLTDIACANHLGIDSILVKTIDVQHQKWYTKINRLREKCILQKMKKIDKEKAEIIARWKEKE